MQLSEPSIVMSKFPTVEISDKNCCLKTFFSQKSFYNIGYRPENFGRSADDLLADDDDDEGREEHAAGLEHVGPDDRLQAADGRVENANL